MLNNTIDPFDGLPIKRMPDSTGVKEDTRIQYPVTESGRFLPINLALLRPTETYPWSSNCAQQYTPPAYYAPPPAPTFPPAPWAYPTHPVQAPAPWASPPYYVPPAAMTAPALISNVAYSTSSRLEEIYDLEGNRYQWQNSGNGNYNFRSDQGNVIYSAMHVSNISDTSIVLDEKNFFTNLWVNGESRAFKGLRLGDFVYFNFTNQPIYVGGNGADKRFLLPTNNLYTLGHLSQIHQPSNPAQVTQQEFHSIPNQLSYYFSSPDPKTLGGSLAIEESNRKRENEIKNAVATAEDKVRVAERAKTREAEALADEARAANVRALAAETDAAAEAAERARAADDQRALAAAQAAQDAAELARAAEKARADAAETRADAEKARADAAETKNLNLIQTLGIRRSQIITLQSKIEEFKEDFEKVQKEITSFFSKNNKEEDVKVKEDEDKSLHWKFNPKQIANDQNDVYNLFSKFLSFQGDGLSQITDEQKVDVTKINLLKLKIIILGMGATEEYSDERNLGSINAILSQISIDNISTDDSETKKFCEKYFNLGQQYKKILDDKQSKDAILDMVSDDFKDEALLLKNKQALEWKKFKAINFKTRMEVQSQKKFTPIDLSSESRGEYDQIKLFAMYEIGLAKACEGYKEITGAISGVDNYSGQITPEIAKVFVVLNNEKQNSFIAKINDAQKQQLKDFIKEEKSIIELRYGEIVGKFQLQIVEKLNKVFWYRCGMENSGTPGEINKVKKSLLKSYETRDKKCDEALKKINLVNDVEAETNPVSQLFKDVTKTLNDLISRTYQAVDEPVQIIYGSKINPEERSQLSLPIRSLKSNVGAEVASSSAPAAPAPAPAPAATAAAPAAPNILAGQA